MKLRRKMIPANELAMVAASESFRDPREPPLSTGNYVRLNSGGPRLLVVEADTDTDTDSVVVAWRDNGGAVHEQEFPRACLHRLA
jgi:uncharacterized protein YodC (DUF2158 family)